MADILIHSAVPSLLTHTASASKLVTNTAVEDSPPNNKYNGHIIQLRNVCTNYSLTEIENENLFPKLNENSVMNHRRIGYKRDIPVEFIRTSSNLSLTSISNENDEVPYAIVKRRSLNCEQHYDFPADAIQQLKKQNDNKNLSFKYSDEQIEKQVIPSVLPSNTFKRMDHLNTIFVKPTKIERSLPKLVFQIDENQQDSNENLEENDYESLSTPIYYEKPGLPEFKDDDNRSVRFSTEPIRVYPTYSPSEYDRSNCEIDPIAASAEYELEKRIENMDIFTVEIEKGSDGLGMSVLGMGIGADRGLEKLGIFVKSLNSDGAVAKDGRIQIGDEIIEVNDESLVGVTHSFATNVLKTATGLVKFVIGREKDFRKSEILGLIEQSLKIDEEHEAMSRAFEQFHDAYYEENFNHDEPTESKISNPFEVEILKQCYQSLEKSFEQTEKEKEHYQKLYEQVQNEFIELEEKYTQAKTLIKELQNREVELCQQHVVVDEQHEKRIEELTKKIEELEQVVALSAFKPEDNLSMSTNECVNSHTQDNHVNINSNPQSPSLTDTSPVECLSISFDKISSQSRPDEQSWHNYSTSNHNKSIDQNSSINKLNQTQIYSKNSPSTYLSTPSLGQVSNDSDLNPPIKIEKMSSVDNTINSDRSTDRYIEIKDWSSDQCIQWLTAQEMTSLIPIFLNRNINGEKLLVLDNSKMKTMGLKSSKERDQLKSKIKELKHTELNRLREQLLSQSTSTTRSRRSFGIRSRFRSSSLSKLKERKFFCSTNTNEK